MKSGWFLPSQAADRALAAGDTIQAGSARHRWHRAESDASGSPYPRRRDFMASAILSVIAFLALVVWRFVFAGPHRRPRVRAIALRQRRHSNLSAEVLHISELGGVAGIAAGPLEKSAE